MLQHLVHFLTVNSTASSVNTTSDMGGHYSTPSSTFNVNIQNQSNGTADMHPHILRHEAADWVKVSFLCTAIALLVGLLFMLCKCLYKKFGCCGCFGCCRGACDTSANRNSGGVTLNLGTGPSAMEMGALNPFSPSLMGLSPAHQQAMFQIASAHQPQNVTQQQPARRGSIANALMPPVQEAAIPPVNAAQAQAAWNSLFGSSANN